MAPSAKLHGKKQWIVVADEAEVIIYSRKGRRAVLDELLRLHNEAARLKSADLSTDRDGRVFDSHGQGRHSVERENADPKRQAAIAFAKSTAVEIAKAGHNNDKFDELIMIASPRFLGLLRVALETVCKITPILCIDKDVVRHDAEFVRKLIRSHEDDG